MLSAISIRNIVLIDQLDLMLDRGMTALTGETGAGKSILLDSLSLALGGRGDASLVRKNCGHGQVVAVLHLPYDHLVRTLLRENEIEDDDEVILRRVQYADGRTRGFINDQPVSAKFMRQLGAHLIEIHGQHDDRALVDPNTHRTLLDAFGDCQPSLKAVEGRYKALGEAQYALNRQEAKLNKAQEDEDFARHVIAELSELNTEMGEEEELSSRRQGLMALEKAADEVRDADQVLNGPNAASSALAGLMRQLMRKGEGDGNLFTPLVESLDASLIALDRSSEALEEIKRQMDFDPLELERTEERLFALRAAARKHHVSCDELPGLLAKYEQAISDLEKGGDDLSALQEALVEARTQYQSAAKKLSDKRAKAAISLVKAVEAELPDLKLGQARFIVDHQIDETRESANGFDVVEFHVQTNPGTHPGPMMKVASGGELSRFLLALKVVLADKGSAPVLIFDEIDTGVGGAVADAIGKRLARLSAKVQVLSVTHAPQVAARATKHLLIEKQVIAEGSLTRTHVAELDDKSRREEVARMLAGSTITDEARAAAHRLIDEVSA
ncbi:DNA repair protein RecN [Maritalea sp.]|uniref:DNA repair protein RecN n=1 Tax=Maritalea sp. TaxID=2003361 RepID=UPI003EFAFD20